MKIRITTGPFKDMELPSMQHGINGHHIFRNIMDTFLVTHAHLDHLSGLVLNSPLIQPPSPKTVAGLPPVICGLKHHIFNGVTWPNLSDDGGPGLIKYKRLREGGDYIDICQGLKSKCYPLSHGMCQLRYDFSDDKFHGPGSPNPASADHDTPKPSVESSAFFIQERESESEIIICGDLEPDSISHNPRNRHLWEQAAKCLAYGTLRAIFIECSYSDEVPDNFLFGHMNPKHLVAELGVLADIVRDKRKQISSTTGEKAIPPDAAPLKGLKVFVIHIKEEFSISENPREKVLGQLNADANYENLGCEFHAVPTGKAVFL